jgi:pSer/pThr/pTyr-binding forkhead associated (FHA) protein
MEYPQDPDRPEGGIAPTEVDSEGARLRLARPLDRIVVEVVGGPMDGEWRRAATGSLTIGRAEDNDLPLMFDPSVSTRHARIVVDQGQYWLEDLQSTNGTFVGEARVDGRALVGPGTLFTIGRTMIELLGS